MTQHCGKIKMSLPTGHSGVGKGRKVNGHWEPMSTRYLVSRTWIGITRKQDPIWGPCVTLILSLSFHLPPCLCIFVHLYQPKLVTWAWVWIQFHAKFRTGWGPGIGLDASWSSHAWSVAGTASHLAIYLHFTRALAWLEWRGPHWVVDLSLDSQAGWSCTLGFFQACRVKWFYF